MTLHALRLLLRLPSSAVCSLRRVRGGIRPLVIACAIALAFVASASSANWGGNDPPKKTPLGRLPSSCNAAPTGKQCIDAAVWYLDRARAKVGLPPYALPANFPSLSPPQQLFILVNLDRVQYGLRPISGLTAALSHDALVRGVWRADDPRPSNTTGLNTWWPGWAGAFRNAPMAYETWVWNDGLGSTNPRCTRTDHSRCWGHRHSVLWKYGPVLAMGAAAGRDSRHHRPGYAYLFVGADAGYTPTYTYTWEQAVADGAGTNPYDPGPSPRSMCHVPILLGKKLRGATRAIEKAHCTLGDVVSKHANYLPGIVIRQYPTWGKTLATGTKISLTVSLGPR
jgi:hypothetical protein